MLVVDDEPDVDELHAAVGEVKPHLSPQGADLGARDVDEALECNMRTVKHSSDGYGVWVQSRPRWATKGGGSAGYEAQLVSQN
jgi:uncharacterized protein involved in high-affinity Fe2+ transport